ncbi:MAG TPA: HK97 family phage prohead protease [Steroidobacteraceae bacterium]|nr:HK97 family phage prohead protease [Steroidobacteraceae bacterium]
MKPVLTVSLEIKALADREFEGHGSIFKNVDFGGDIVLPGAFKRSLAAHRKAGSMPQMFWMHDPSRVPGKWIDMHEDSKGLAVKGVLADTELGNEIRTLLKMDAVRGLSIGYVTKDQDFDDDGNRLLKEVDLWEVSVVSMPMNPLAQVTHSKTRLSASGEYVPTAREFEHFFREKGCSKSVARRLVAKIFEDSGAMPDDSRWDAGHVDLEAVKEALSRNEGRFYAGALKR